MRTHNATCHCCAISKLAHVDAPAARLQLESLASQRRQHDQQHSMMGIKSATLPVIQAPPLPPRVQRSSAAGVADCCTPARCCCSHCAAERRCGAFWQAEPGAVRQHFECPSTAHSPECWAVEASTWARWPSCLGWHDMSLGWLAKTHAKHMCLVVCAQFKGPTGAACTPHSCRCAKAINKSWCVKIGNIWCGTSHSNLWPWVHEVWDCPTALWCGNFFTGSCAS